MITIFAGPMFSGKTTALIDHASRTGVNYVWKPQKDVRDRATVVRSHDGIEVRAEVLEQVSQVILSGPDTIYVDEAQFLSNDLAVEIAFLGENRDIYLSMLDMDYLGNKFPAYEIFTRFNARVIIKHARCEICSKPARFSHRIVDSSDLILCGSKESYEPRCFEHFPVLCVPREVS